MKHLKIIALYIFAGIVFSLQLYASLIPIDGKWDGKGKRTLLPAPPEASINDTTLSIHFLSAISGLQVYVMDENGEIVYQTVISSSVSNYTCDLDWEAIPGTYQLLLQHASYGYVGGSFTVE